MSEIVRARPSCNAELQGDVPGYHGWGQGQKTGKSGLGSKKGIK